LRLIGKGKLFMNKEYKYTMKKFLIILYWIACALAFYVAMIAVSALILMSIFYLIMWIV